jgi:hypothetical protein
MNDVGKEITFIEVEESLDCSLYFDDRDLHLMFRFARA